VPLTLEPGGLDYALIVRLRAVRERGEACEVAGEIDRCVRGTCEAGRCT
jgi:hypothetical protein